MCLNAKIRHKSKWSRKFSLATDTHDIIAYYLGGSFINIISFLHCIPAASSFAGHSNAKVCLELVACLVDNNRAWDLVTNLNRRNCTALKTAATSLISRLQVCTARIYHLPHNSLLASKSFSVHFITHFPHITNTFFASLSRPIHWLSEKTILSPTFRLSSLMVQMLTNFFYCGSIWTLILILIRSLSDESPTDFSTIRIFEASHKLSLKLWHEP